ncbi:hypothetical protein TNCV_4392231 [Trichonephila clavipes]|nr:hypothetical protein TNCV_4392231 [Trichonephila clavipes]
MEIPLRTAYGQNGRCGMQPKAKHSLRAQAQLMRTETVETVELVKVKQKLLREREKENARGSDSNGIHRCFEDSLGWRTVGRPEGVQFQAQVDRWALKVVFRHGINSIRMILSSANATAEQRHLHKIAAWHGACDNQSGQPDRDFAAVRRISRKTVYKYLNEFPLFLMSNIVCPFDCIQQERPNIVGQKHQSGMGSLSFIAMARDSPDRVFI